MPQTLHLERHFTASEVVRDVVIGMADGLTVPFALAAGLTGAVASAGIIVTAGLAEIAAGSIAMGLGGYLAAKSDAEHYAAEQRREQQEVIEKPREEMQEVADILRAYGMDEEHIKPAVEAMRQRPKQWIDFMMRFELGLEKPDPKRALVSALVIAGSYVAGGLVPLVSFLGWHTARIAPATAEKCDSDDPPRRPRRVGRVLDCTRDRMSVQRVIADAGAPVKIWTSDVEEEAEKQLRNIAGLPFIFHHVAVMPDVHFGKGATVGSVIATKGAVIPAAVGVDIGCGMAAVRTDLTSGDFADKDAATLRHSIERGVPVGFNAHKEPTSGALDWSRERSEEHTS